MTKPYTLLVSKTPLGQITEEAGEFSTMEEAKRAYSRGYYPHGGPYEEDEFSHLQKPVPFSGGCILYAKGSFAAVEFLGQPTTS